MLNLNRSKNRGILMDLLAFIIKGQQALKNKMENKLIN